MISSAEDIKKLGTILCVWAHPDDETFCAAGLLSQAVANGQDVICLTATKGEAGVYNETKWPADKIAAVREAEVKKALDLIGVKNHHWLDCRDGECEKSAESAIPKIFSYAQQYKPDTIITFGPEGLTGHDDHKAVSKWTDEVVKKLSKKPLVLHVVTDKNHFEKYLTNLDSKLNMYFMIDQPKLVQKDECEVFFELSPELQDLKYQTLKVQESQTEKMMKEFSKAELEKAFGLEVFVKAKS